MSAIFSEYRKYRYRLTRKFGNICGDGACCFVMLNPSTADETIDDPTIRRCIGYAQKFGCDRLEVVNLFAYRSTSPDLLYGMSRDEAIGAETDKHIAEACNASRIVICAWGESRLVVQSSGGNIKSHTRPTRSSPDGAKNKR